MKYLLSFLFCFNLYAGSPQGVPVHTQATVGTSDSIPLAANANRGYLFIQNQGTVDCRVAYNKTVAATGGSILLQAGQYLEPIEAFSKTNIHMTCLSAGQTIEFVETNW